MPDILFPVPHGTVVMTAATKPYRFRAECTFRQCGWVGDHWVSTAIAEAEGRLHRLANCDHPGAMSIHPLADGDPSLICTECGAPVVAEKDDRGRFLILAAPEEESAVEARRDSDV